MFNNEIYLALFAAFIAGQPPPQASTPAGVGTACLTTQAQRLQARLARLPARQTAQPLLLAQYDAPANN